MTAGAGLRRLCRWRLRTLMAAIAIGSVAVMGTVETVRLLERRVRYRQFAEVYLAKADLADHVAAAVEGQAVELRAWTTRGALGWPPYVRTEEEAASFRADPDRAEAAARRFEQLAADYRRSAAEDLARSRVYAAASRRPWRPIEPEPGPH